MCRMQIQWGLQLEGKTINTEEKRQKQWWRVKHTVDKKNKRGNKNVVKKKKSISMGNVLAVVLLTAPFATLYFLGSVRI